MQVFVLNAQDKLQARSFQSDYVLNLNMSQTSFHSHRSNSSKKRKNVDHLNLNFNSWKKLELCRAKLKVINKISSLMSGFAMIAMVETQLDPDTQVPDGLLIAFVVCTCLLVVVHMFALLISTCILPNVEASTNLKGFHVMHEFPHETMHWYIELGWIFTTIVGMFLFLCELAILCWVKFIDLSCASAASGTVIMVPVLVLFMGFAVHFYRKLSIHQNALVDQNLQRLDELQRRLKLSVVHGGSGSSWGSSGIGRSNCSVNYNPGAGSRAYNNATFVV